ncbi:hypothetical protein Y1Q_0016892 [Alligator mississippiensis]|uniref:Transmembrane protein 53 n=1 Tax=Alligator mississippiensis TaxID=8496 RepID=A0A151NK27_ALLMI|nr:hypothetical protein Y1Q_0016892 [Alligator mississippiensis]
MQAAPAVAPETPAPTGTVLAPTIRLYRLEEGTACPPPTASGPLLLLLPWLGARPRAIARYVALYQQRGMDVLVAETTLCHFLWPRQGLAYAGRVLALLEETPALGARPLLVHALSAGAYAFAQMLVHLSRAPERHGQLAARVRGLVYDSLVTGDLANAALGECGPARWTPGWAGSGGLQPAGDLAARLLCTHTCMCACTLP